MLRLPDRGIVEAYGKATGQNVLAAVNNDIFFGYWCVCADGQGFGHGCTYPSLDGHQMTDALLRLGQVDVVKANFDYVRSFQRPDGLLPIAVLPGRTEVRGAPIEPNGALYRHWAPGDPLLALGSCTYIQNAEVIFRYTQDRQWLERQLSSVNPAGDFLATLIDDRGRVGGAGYYIERPPRIKYDGIAQGYAADAFRRLSALNRAAGDEAAAEKYATLGDRIAAAFRREFWAGDHCVEYIHPQHGAVAGHGLTDVDWMAIASGLAGEERQAILWQKLKDETGLYYGGMPTGIAARPEAYEPWEFFETDRPRHDLAAMGRVWYIECWARARMGDGQGIVDTLRRVCKVGRDNGYYWHERYHPTEGDRPAPAGPNTYCEYASNLIRIVQRFLLGVEFELDGSIALAPTVPPYFWEAGFGQTLRWRSRSLAYEMRRGRVAGSYVGQDEQELRIRFNPLPAQVEFVVGGRREILPVKEKTFAVRLPSSEHGRQFEVNAIDR